MSILFVLLTFLLIISLSTLRKTQEKRPAKPEVWVTPRVPRMEQEYGFQIPQDYCFHQGHTWCLKETPETARVGLDNFAANLLGKIDRVEVAALNRWVRQGQRLMKAVLGGIAVELLSPVEGVVTAVNSEVLQNPELISSDPYKNGWIALVKAPDLAVNQKNLVQGSMVAPWLQQSIARLNGMLAQISPAMAQDGGLPVKGVLAKVTPELREKLVDEFFLS
jgi:glycine cleavage system H lipoate-binding protein